MSFDTSFGIIPQVKEKMVPRGDLTITQNAGLGSGELWVVHKGWWNGREVAIKETAYSPHELTGGPLSMSGHMEFFSHCRFTHPNIVSFAAICLNFGKNKAKFAAVTDLGENLYTWLKNNPVQDEQTSYMEVCLAEGTAKGLSYLHSQNIKHGQIHPGNILVYSDHIAKIDDYALMSLRYGMRDSFKDYLPVASSKSCYVCRRSPEMYTEEFRDIQSKPEGYKPVDVYALGLTLLEMTSRKPPFAGKNNACVEKLLKANETPEIPDHLSIHCLTPLIARCIAFDPAVRPTADAMANELAKIKFNFRKINFAKVLIPFLWSATPVFVGADGKKYAATKYVIDRIKDPISLILGFAEQLDEKHGAPKLPW